MVEKLFVLSSVQLNTLTLQCLGPVKYLDTGKVDHNVCQCSLQTQPISNYLCFDLLTYNLSRFVLAEIHSGWAKYYDVLGGYSLLPTSPVATTRPAVLIPNCMYFNYLYTFQMLQISNVIKQRFFTQKKNEKKNASVKFRCSVYFGIVYL